MSVMTTEKSLPGKAFAPLATAERPALEPDLHITSKTRMLRLPAVALATLRVRTGPADEHADTRGVVTDACHRLAVLWARGSQMSAYGIAGEFQYMFFPTGVSGWSRSLEPVRRVPLKGLDLIRGSEELGAFGVEWRTDVPTEHDPYTFETVRLSEALERFAPTVESAATSGPKHPASGDQH